MPAVAMPVPMSLYRRTLVGSPSMLLAPACAEGVARVLVHRELAAGQQPHLGHRVQAALAVGIEGADRVDLVAEQVDAVRHGRAHREQIDQPAAHRVLAGRDHLAHVGVAGQRQLRFQRRLVEPLLLLEVEGVGRQKARRGEAHERGRGGQQHHVDLALARAGALGLQDAPQRGQALGDQVLVRREGVVGQRLPIRETRRCAIRARRTAARPSSRWVSAGSAVTIAVSCPIAAREPARTAPTAAHRPTRAGGAGCGVCQWQWRGRASGRDGGGWKSDAGSAKQIAPRGGPHRAISRRDYRIRGLDKPA